MRRELAVLLVGALMVPRMLTAQTVAPGGRVRVSHPGEGTRIGIVVAFTDDTLAVRFAGRSDTAHLPLDQVTQLHVSRGKQRHSLAPAGAGFVMGAAVGAVAGAAAGSDCSTSTEMVCVGRGAGALVTGAALGVIGAAIGAIAGLSPSERWDRVPLDRSRFAIIAPTRIRGSGLAMSLAF